MLQLLTDRVWGGAFAYGHFSDKLEHTNKSEPVAGNRMPPYGPTVINCPAGSGGVAPVEPDPRVAQGYKRPAWIKRA